MATGTTTATTTAVRRASSSRPDWGVIPWLGIAIPGRLTYRVWQRHRDVYFQLWRVNLIPPLVEPVITILAMGLGLGVFVELDSGQDYIQFVAPGVLAVFPMFAAVFESLWSAHFRLEQHGTYVAMLSTPVRAEDIAFGELIWSATRALISHVSILVVMALMTPSWDLITSPLVILTLPIAALMGVAFAAMGLVYTALTRTIHQLMYFFTLVITPMFWFGGVFFPLDELPGWVKTVAWFVPITHVVDLFRALTFGGLEWGHLADLAWLIVFTIPLVWLAIWAMRRRLVQ